MMTEAFLRLVDASYAELIGSFTLADAAVLVGIATGLLSALVNLVYTWRKDRREQRASDAALARQAVEKQAE